MPSKIVLITGAAHGIGFTVAKYLLLQGDIVIPTDVDSAVFKSFVDDQNAFPLRMDVTDEESVHVTMEKLRQKYEYIDCIVNNAGIFIGGPIVEVDIEDYRKIWDINLMGYVRIIKAFFPLLRKESRVINISSEVGRITFPFTGPYTITKYAVEAFSDCLRRELMFKDIKVIKIQPGSINTRFVDRTKTSFKQYCEGSAFENQINRVWRVLASEGNAEPIFMAKAIYKAIHKKHPKYRYRIKNNRTRRVLEFLPARFVDYLLKNVIKK
ncbi:MAG: SDR family NAD(P)-dependent oxidoreductase [Candidatus Lokiarchaeota archaeon]|nr:SDR family NAD(P)-dependent oxidoreductase [Candidatus Lokiarchaeota archaeon]